MIRDAPDPAPMESMLTRARARSWILTTYFAEGFPYSLVRQVSTVFFKDAGASLESLGLTSLFGLPWTLKFLQAPLVDGFSSRKRWVVGMELLLALAIGLLALGAEASSASGLLTGVAALFLLVAVLSATHDVAVDGLYLDLMDRSEQARFVGFQAMSYRLALIVGGGGVVYLSGKLGWGFAFMIASGLMAALALLHGLGLKPGMARAPPSKSPLSLFHRALLNWIDQPRILIILAFLLTYRLGENLLLGMVYPMLSGCGVSRAQYGLMYGTFGVSASILGGILGGWLIGRFGLARVAWVLVLAQNLPNLLYSAAASLFGKHTPMPEGASLPFETLAVLTSFVSLEALGAGMGTALFMVFVMRTTRADFRASHMAIATGIMNVAGILTGTFSGLLAERTGFPLFFALTFLATVPGMLLIPFLPHLDRGGKERQVG